MANFWDADPVAPSAPAQAGGNWWDSDPVATTGGVQTIPAQNGRPTRVIMDMGSAPAPRTGVAEDVVKAGGSGIAKGVSSLLGLPGDAAEAGAQGINYLTQIVSKKLGLDIPNREARPATFGSADIGKAIHSALQELGINSDYKPATMPGEFSHTIGEFAPAALVGGGGIAARAAGAVIPAVASETAGQMTKGKPAEPWARGIAAVLGGAGTGLLTRPGSTARALREQLPEGVTPQQVTQAEALINDARQAGVDLAWPEALSQVAGRPVLTNTMRHLEASPQTEARMAEFFGQRPQQVEGATRSALDTIAPVNHAPSSIGHAVGREAEGHVNDVREMINAASEPFYTRAQSVLLTPQEMQRVRALPGYPEAANAVLNDPQLARYVQGMPENSVGFLNEVKKQLDQAGRNAASPVAAQQNMQRSAGFGLDATAVRDAARRASPDYDTALAIQSGGREQILQPILDSYVGKLAQKDLTTKKAIDTLFPASPLANSEQEIARAVQTLANRNPRVAGDVVRSYLEQSFNKSARDLHSGVNQAGGAKFRTAIVGDAQQEANLGSAIMALPNGDVRWQGFNRLLEVLEATGTRQNIGSKTAYNMARDQADTGGFVRDALKVASNPLKAAQPIIDRYEKYKLGDNLEQLARIVTDPRSGNLFRAIARMDPGSSAARSVATRLLTIGGAARPIDNTRR